MGALEVAPGPRTPGETIRHIVWANLSPPIGRRPVLLLTRTPGYTYLTKVIVAEVTSTVRGIPQEVPVGKREGLSHASIVNLDNAHVIPKASLGERLGGLASVRVCAKSSALSVMLSTGLNSK